MKSATGGYRKSVGGSFRLHAGPSDPPFWRSGVLVSVAANAERTCRHAHLVGFYVRDTELISAVTGFLTDVLERDGAAVVIATEPHRAALAQELRERGISPHELAIARRYRPID